MKHQGVSSCFGLKIYGAVFGIVASLLLFFALLISSAGHASAAPNAGELLGRCTGWPAPRIELEWSASPPPGSLPKNSNSVLKSVNGTAAFWFFAGGYPGVDGTRIDGTFASAWGPSGYPEPNYAVTDLQDTNIQAGNTYVYRVKYRPEASSNPYQVLVSQANCSDGATAPAVALNASPASVTSGGTTTLSWSSTNTTTCVARDDWSGAKSLSGSQIISNIQRNSVYTIECSNAAGQTAVSTVTVLLQTQPPADGTIQGTCTWNDAQNEPQVNLAWSRNPPPNAGVAATTNSIQKGDFYPDDIARYWGFLPINPAEYVYTDHDLTLNTQYQYRVKYRTDLTSSNTYNIFVSAATCGGPVVTGGDLEIVPHFQSVLPNVTAFLSAIGGNGTYAWSAPEGAISGSGPTIGVTYTNNSENPSYKQVTLTSGNEVAEATVQVDGVQTFTDEIDLVGGGTRFITINGDAEYTYSTSVTLALAHGFPMEAASLVQMRISNALSDVAVTPLQPYQTQMSWDLCRNLFACPEGIYTVYGIFRDSQGVESEIVLDSITYLFGPQDQPRVLINGDAPTTQDRQVMLTLTHGFISADIDAVTMQIANKPGLVDVAPRVPYAPSIPNWDLCDGYGSVCPNGTKTVYVRYCVPSACQTVVLDSIDLQSLWPDWGVRINDDAAQTAGPDVQLTLNPWFDLFGTEVLVSNFPDFSNGVSMSYAPQVSWDLCAQRIACTGNVNYTVYVRYSNKTGIHAWPAATSPRYQDDIILGTSAPTPGVLINGGAATTTSQTVRLNFRSPFASLTGVSMRPINESGLSQRDRDLIAAMGGGIDSQPTLSQFGRGFSGPAPAVQILGIPELESGTARPFQSTLSGWDLCGETRTCPYGTYKVYVQYYRTPSAPGSDTALGALGDEISAVYYDTIVYTSPTPTPSPTPTVSEVPVPSGSPGVPSGPGSGSGGGLSEFIDALVDAISGAGEVIGPLSVISAIAVAMSAIVALIPLLGSGVFAFAYQWLMAALGLLPKRKKVWGTVYDANTKRPIPFARVQLLDRSKRVLETRIADKDGRYGFLTTPESLMAQNLQIYIVAGQQGYLFPSRIPASIDTFVYNNLYYGELIEVNDRTLINFDIPLDPVKPSHAPLVLKSPSIALGAGVAAIADAGFWLGLIMVPLNFILSPNPFTFGVLCLFLGTASLRIFGISEHPFGVVKDSITGKPMPFALITLNDLSGKRVAFTVSDERGRYFLVAEKGAYEIAVFTPANITPPRQSRTVIQARKGWITREITL